MGFARLCDICTVGAALFCYLTSRPRTRKDIDIDDLCSSYFSYAQFLDPSLGATDSREGSNDVSRRLLSLMQTKERESEQAAIHQLHTEMLSTFQVWDHTLYEFED